MKSGDAQFLGDSTIVGECAGFSENGTFSDAGESVPSSGSLQVDISLSKEGHTWGTIWLTNDTTSGPNAKTGVRVFFTNAASSAYGYDITTYSKSMGHSRLSRLQFNTGTARVYLADARLNTAGDTIELTFTNTVFTAQTLAAVGVWAVAQ